MKTYLKKKISKVKVEQKLSSKKDEKNSLQPAAMCNYMTISRSGELALLRQRGSGYCEGPEGALKKLFNPYLEKAALA